MFELKHIVRHALTVLLGQLAAMGFGVADTLIVGRYAPEAVAVLSVGTAIYISVYVALMGMMQALMPIWSELYGGQRTVELGVSVRQALYIAGASAAIGMGVLLYPEPLMHATQVPLAIQAEIKNYLAILALTLPPTLLFRLYSTLNQSLGKPRLVTWLQIAALAIKVPLSIALTFGFSLNTSLSTWQLSPMGAAGCAWSTLVVNYSMLLAAIVLLRTQKFYQPYGLWRRLEAPRWRTLGSFARLGVPVAISILVEITSFSMMALFISRQGVVPTAAHQIAANIISLLYMVPLSISIATSARVSYWMGASQTSQARQALYRGYLLTLFAALCLALTLSLWRQSLAALYSNNPATVVLAATLLGWVALLHIADAIQVLCNFVLRCYRVTMTPLLIYAILLWGLGLGCGYLWTYHGLGSLPPWRSPETFWACSTGALFTTAALLSSLLALKIKQRQ